MFSLLLNHPATVIHDVSADVMTLIVTEALITNPAAMRYLILYCM